MNFEKPEKSEFWKIEKKLLKISSFYTCTKNHNHMRYSFWDMEWDRIFCQFGPFFIFCPPPPHSPINNNPGNQNFEWKKIWRCHHFKLVQQKNMIIWCMLTQIWSMTDINFYHFRPFFALLSHYWPQICTCYTCAP